MELAHELHLIILSTFRLSEGRGSSLTLLSVRKEAKTIVNYFPNKVLIVNYQLSIIN